MTNLIISYDAEVDLESRHVSSEETGAKHLTLARVWDEF